MSKKVAVIGAGIGGLAVAARLARSGYEVTIYEANEYVGGKASEITDSGYRFDAGPSVITMLENFTELFDYCGEDFVSMLHPTKIDMQTRYFYGDKVFDVYSTRSKLRRELEQKTSLSNERFDKYLADLQGRYRNIGKFFLGRNPRLLRTYFSMDFIRAIKAAFGFNILRTMHSENESRLADPLLVRIFDRYATYYGANPYKAPSLLNMIASVEIDQGSYTVRGGIAAIVKSLHSLAVTVGSQIITNTRVTSIVRLDSGKLQISSEQGDLGEFDIVISNLDRSMTEKVLLGRDIDLPSTDQLSTSAVVFYLGMQGIVKSLVQHNIFFSDDYEAEFAAIEAGKVSTDPTIYVNISARAEPTDAPEGCENWFVMINVPARHLTRKEIKALRSRVLKRLSAVLEVDVQARIVTESMKSPMELENDSGGYMGSLYGSTPNSLLGLVKPANRDANLSNLYYVGGTVHPGGGMPLVLQSARLVADEIIKHG